MKPERYDWEDIPVRVPTDSGIYAWYSVPELSVHDIEQCAKECSELIAQGLKDEATARVHRLIVDSILLRSEPAPYDIEISGPLKPRYSGSARFLDPFSPEVLLNIASDPERLHALRRALKHSAPWFVAPLYIGMSGNLRDRLRSHKALIEQPTSNPFNLPSDVMLEDQSFASEIRRRGIAPSSLFVFAQVHGGNPAYSRDIEYLLNRSTFPVLGRR